MLRHAAVLEGYAVFAGDDEIGTIGDFLFDHTNWQVRWLVVNTGNFLAGRKILLPPSAVMLPDPGKRRVSVEATMRQARESRDNDPHLRSVATVTGYHIHATDGDCGHIEDFLIRDTDWSIQFLVIDTKNWWHGESILISPRTVKSIDETDGSVRLDIDRERMKNRPAYDAALPVHPAYEEYFRAYYNGGPPGKPR